MTRFTVNGQPVHYRMDPETPLLFALRDASNLTGTKYGCGMGQCGACTVMIDGQAVRSCQVTIAQIEGSFVTTIEGLSRDRSHPVQQAFAAESAVQCGHCTPGFVMAVAALLDSTPNPSEAEIDRALSNLCPCGTYPRVRRAVRRAAQMRAGGVQTAAAPPPGIPPGEASQAVPALRVPPKNEAP